MVGHVSMSLGFYSLRSTQCERRRASRVNASGDAEGQPDYSRRRYREQKQFVW